jgi:hydrogenase nickel incorporation protein HypB
MQIIEVERKIIAKNDEIAQENRRFFEKEGVYVYNLLSSPGAGKTSILERILDRLKDKVNIGVMVGDVQTANDAERLDKYNIQVVQIITNGGCHLNSMMIKNGIGKVNFNNIDILFIENVGNLVCPSNFDLGENCRIVITSTTEGDDKPLKYAPIFYSANVLIINKIDLLPYLPANMNEIKNNSLKINPKLKIFEVSALNGNGIDGLCNWIIGNIKR